MNNVNFSLAARIFSISLVASLMLMGTAMGEISREGLVAEWFLKNDTKDSSGNGNDGIMYGADGTILAGTHGWFGKEFNPYRVDNYVIVADANSLDIVQPITIEALFMFRTPPELSDKATPLILGKGDWSAQRSNYHVFIELRKGAICDYGSIVFATNPYGSWKYYCSNTKVRPDTWSHFIATYNGIDVKLYVNGELDKTISENVSLVPNNNPLYIGYGLNAPLDNGNHYFKGLIVEIRLYNRTLSAEEVRTHYESGQSISAEYVYYPAQTSWTPWNVILPAVIIIVFAVFFLLIRQKPESKKEESIAKMEIKNLTDQKIKLWVYLLFFFAGILSFPLALIFVGIFSGTLVNLQNAFFTSGILAGFYAYFFSLKINNILYLYGIIILPLFVCSIFFSVGMYVFKKRSYIFAFKAFVSSFVASVFILIIFPIFIPIFIGFSSPLLILFLIIIHLAVYWFIHETYPSMMFPLKAFISSFYPLFLIMLIIWVSFYLFLVGSRTFGH